MEEVRVRIHKKDCLFDKWIGIIVNSKDGGKFKVQVMPTAKQCEIVSHYAEIYLYLLPEEIKPC